MAFPAVAGITPVILVIKTIWGYSKLYLLWIVIHYLSSNAYVYFCTPQTVWGVLQSPFMVITPQCYTIDWIQRKSRDITHNMWMIIGMGSTNAVYNYLTPTTLLTKNKK